MKVLLVTGKLAEGRVREIASKHGCRVFVAREEVASLIKPRALAEDLTGQRVLLEDVDLILVPGLMLGDIGVVEEAAGVKTYRGPRDIADLDVVLANLGRLRLSKRLPADKLLAGKLKRKAAEELKEVRAAEYIKARMRKPGNFMIGGLPVGLDFPARIVAEVVGADELSDREVLARARYYLREGADIIDIGMNSEDPGRAAELVQLLRKLKAPLSIDTMEKENIRAALGAGVDLVLSFDHELLLEFRDVATPSVVIPRKEGIPLKPEERVRVLEENIALARRRGFSSIIADPLLQPLSLGFVDSILAYREFSRKHELPMLMGVGNVTELLDADSPGVNALLCGIAMEIGACLLFTTEAGDKTRGSVRELSTAAKMMYLSSRRGCLPKDLGIDLLILKEKKIKRDIIKVKSIEKIKARREKLIQMDKKGYFKIFVDEKINCIHYYKNKPHLLIEGKKARDICDTIYSLGLVADMGHALYLGQELARAEEALILGKSYRQS
jgi:dihydropteroate synthase-like protein